MQNVVVKKENEWLKLKMKEGSGVRKEGGGFLRAIAPTTSLAAPTALPLLTDAHVVCGCAISALQPSHDLSHCSTPSTSTWILFIYLCCHRSS